MMMKKFYTYLLAVTAGLAVMSGCKDPVPAPEPEPNPDPTEKVPTIAVATVDAAATISTATIKVTVTNANKFSWAFYVKGARPADDKIQWTDVAVTADGDFEVLVDNLPVSVDERVIYSFEAFAVGVDSVSANKVCNFQTLKANPIMITDIKASATKISFKSLIVEGHAEAFFFNIVEKSAWDEEVFVMDCEKDFSGKYINPLVTDKEAICTNSYNLRPLTEHYIAYVTAVKGEDGDDTYYTDGDVVLIDISTSDFEFNASTVDVAMVVDEPSTTFSSAKVKVTRNSTDCDGFYAGAVDDATLNNRDMQTYLDASDWLINNYEMASVSFRDDYSGSYTESKDHTFNLLKQNTPYTLFVIAYNKQGQLGVISTKQITTKTLTFDDPASVSLTITPSYTTTKISATFENGCAKVVRKIVPSGDLTLEEATALLVGDIEWGETLVDGDNDLSNLAMNFTYDMFVLPVSSTDGLGTVVKHTFKTLDAVFDGNGTISAIVKSCDYVEADNMFNLNLTTTLGGGATKFNYQIMNAELLPPGATLEDFAKRSIGDGYYQTHEGGGELLLTPGTWDNNSWLVMIPVDGDGKLGTPYRLLLDMLDAPLIPLKTKNLKRK